MYARESFTIAEVADLLSIRRLSDSYQTNFRWNVLFVGDLRGKCSFCIRKNGELKNVYHCYHCGAAGNMLTLYAELSGIYGRNRYKEAYREIKQELLFLERIKDSSPRHEMGSFLSFLKRNAFPLRKRNGITGTMYIRKCSLFLSLRKHTGGTSSCVG